MTDQATTPAGAPMTRPVIHCSFCAKSQYTVRKMIAGPMVYICDECVELCLDIIRGHVPRPTLPPPLPPPPREPQAYVRDLSPPKLPKPPRERQTANLAPPAQESEQPPLDQKELSPLELERLIPMREASYLTSLSRSALDKLYPHLIRRLTPRRCAMRLGDVLAIGRKNGGSE